ncbi:hypothetical protein GCM10007108_11070 [Thermogymnomonas acidicola]|uniref:Uncharacterized protein n=1 Tax=Thermogymnomonas acidicola TaxID=399579 RepID=A0AA37FAX2_9ARCH|nr:hypothetical protein [Thermogymnomonas acidicola]GGM74854.1 hypothetical protein GCM10007108_11070 [Thermogymnomonas acidicola]
MVDSRRILTVQNGYRFVGLFLLLFGIGFYLAWSILYDTWADIGVYSFTVVLVVFGILTLVLVDTAEKERNT